MITDRKLLEDTYEALSAKTKSRLKRAVDWIVKAKQEGGKVVAVVGSGPNLHEGVTTLIAELIHKEIIDGALTSSAVISHEMAGTLEKVKRIDGETLGFERDKLPSDGFLEVSMISPSRLEDIRREIPIDASLYRRMRRTKGNVIIKVAGNIAYPTGLRTERLAREILSLAKRHNSPFEQMVGYGADPMTMIGAGARHNITVLVTVPQLVGGGEIGLAIGDSLSIAERSHRIAKLLEGATVIIESGLALSQEIHDGPLERFTGHGIWTDWEGDWTYSLAQKKVVRIDLDPNLEKAWMNERRSKMVTDAVHKGLPKTKTMRIPFRMEMSGFARIPGSLPIIGDIGEIWPLLATRIANELQIKLDFMSYKQSSSAGEKVREWIVKNVRPVDRDKLFAAGKAPPPSEPCSSAGSCKF
jgi:hypothetical protein